MRRNSLAKERPDLLSQWSPYNELSPSDISCGSHRMVLWKCSIGHIWKATIKNRALLNSNCPYCTHRAVLEGYNDLLTLNPSLAKTWSPENTIKPSDVLPYSNKRVIWQCENGHKWTTRIADRTMGHGCPFCSKNLRQTS